MTRSTFYGVLNEYFAQRGTPLKPAEISPQANLFDLQLLDSVAIVDLILHLEQTLGRPIDVASTSPRAFHSLESMYDTLCIGEAIDVVGEAAVHAGAPRNP